MTTRHTVTVRELNAYAIILENDGCVANAREVRERVLGLVASGKTEVCLDADPRFASNVRQANFLLENKKAGERQ